MMKIWKRIAALLLSLAAALSLTARCQYRAA